MLTTTTALQVAAAGGAAIAWLLLCGRTSASPRLLAEDAHVQRCERHAAGARTREQMPATWMRLLLLCPSRSCGDCTIGQQQQS